MFGVFLPSLIIHFLMAWLVSFCYWFVSFFEIIIFISFMTVNDTTSCGVKQIGCIESLDGFHLENGIFVFKFASNG